MTDLTQYARQGSAFKWETIGETLKGTVTKVGELRTGPNRFNPDHEETVLPFTVETDDGEEWGVYARLQPYSSLGGAVVDAVTAAGETALQVGATIAIQYLENKDTGKPQPAKIFVAQYKAPVAGVDLGAVAEQSAPKPDLF